MRQMDEMSPYQMVDSSKVVTSDSCIAGDKTLLVSSWNMLKAILKRDQTIRDFSALLRVRPLGVKIVMVENEPPDRNSA